LRTTAGGDLRELQGDRGLPDTNPIKAAINACRVPGALGQFPDECLAREARVRERGHPQCRGTGELPPQSPKRAGTPLRHQCRLQLVRADGRDHPPPFTREHASATITRRRSSPVSHVNHIAGHVTAPVREADPGWNRENAFSICPAMRAPGHRLGRSLLQHRSRKSRATSPDRDDPRRQARECGGRNRTAAVVIHGRQSLTAVGVSAHQQNHRSSSYAGEDARRHLLLIARLGGESRARLAERRTPHSRARSTGCRRGEREGVDDVAAPSRSARETPSDS